MYKKRNTAVFIDGENAHNCIDIRRLHAYNIIIANLLFLYGSME